MRRELLNGLAQLDIPDTPFRGSRRREFQPLEAPAFRKETVIHFREIVILRRQPEYRDGVHAVFTQFACDMNGGERLINAVRGTAKQAHLLPSHNSNCTISQTV